MSIQLDKFFRKNQITPSEVLYLVREEGKTVIYLTDGRLVKTFTPLKTVAEGLQDISLLSINKGVMVNELQVISVNCGSYAMADGRTFHGRVRTPGEHTRNKTLITKRLSSAPRQMPLEERFSVLDNFPLPFCIIELTFGREGHGIDFIFRYCNKAMEEFEQISLDKMIDRTYFEVFPDGERKWLISFSDIALHGGTKIIDAYKTNQGSVRVYCFQPKEGYCACALVRC